jgi:hypothetical protein
MPSPEPVDLDCAVVLAGEAWVEHDQIEFHRLTRGNSEKRPDVLKIGANAKPHIRLNKEVRTKVE